ncbi:superoxide dismutase family protein [Rhizobiales bacterium RZME27]|uniref:Superoxide dismutase family protein n=1 Tax=Endobacterium cereale TaxID=2663029 RepID=A0A6A8AEI6_9HYPH|nr:superoxide dismutase family protein [Endobacterium cereale]MEB2847314.1 superoxide dismutase family protein [Endobacterium cereale]MQY49164.1 superoxide dismutase family protein [Endobacterium cereale]
MKTITTFAAIALASSATLTVAADQVAPATAAGTAKFVGAKGEDAGKADLITTPSGVLINVEIKGLPASQWVAFHVHETGSCDAASHHESAGGHFNPDGKEHGYQAANGPHAGDMPNQYVGADGVLRAQVINDAVTLDKGEVGIVGRALMVHAKPDDYKTQPSGAAGDRLACAVIE